MKHHAAVDGIKWNRNLNAGIEDGVPDDSGPGAMQSWEHQMEYNTR
ncbi:hypothetical protein M2409_004726 [Sphingobacterium sp. JUb21]|nr:hypothetical protein [Sphingobacterium sp. JUb21]